MVSNPRGDVGVSGKCSGALRDTFGSSQGFCLLNGNGCQMQQNCVRIPTESGLVNLRTGMPFQTCFRFILIFPEVKSESLCQSPCFFLGYAIQHLS